jgi:MFS family permease
MKNDYEKSELQVSTAQAYYILIICSLLYMVNYMDRQVLAVTVEPIKQEFGLSDAQIGMIFTMFFMGMAFFAFPSAYLVDRWSRRKAISVMAFLWSAFTFATGLARNFLSLFIPRFLVGVGEAGFTSGGTPLIAAAFPRRSRSKAMGVFNLAIPIGAALGMLLGGILSKNFGWRAPFFIFCIPGIVLGVLVLFCKDYKTVEHIDEFGQRQGFVETALSLFKIPSLRWLYLGCAMQNTLAYSLLTWGPAFIMRAQGVKEDKAGMIVSIVAFMAIFGAIIGGFVADMWQRKSRKGRMYAAAFGIGAATCFYIPALLLDFQGIGFAIGIVFGIFLVASNPAIYAISQDVVPPALRGVSWGMNVACQYVFGGAWGPLVVGAISDFFGGGTFGLRVGLLCSAISGVLGMMFFLMGSRCYPADVDKVKDLMVEPE